MRIAKGILLAVALMVFVATVGYFSGSVAFRLQAQGKVDAFRVPRSVVIEIENFTTRNGARLDKVGTQEIIAFREDGTKAQWIKHNKAPQLGYFQRTVDFPGKGERVDMDVAGGTKTSVRSTSAQVAARIEYLASGKYGNCVGEIAPQLRGVLVRTVEGIEDIQGLKVVRTKEVDQRTKQTTVSWLAPDYHCLLVQQTATQGDTEFRRILKSVKFSTPDASMFDIPSSLREASPSGAERALMEKVFGSIDNAPACIRARHRDPEQLRRMDAVYERAAHFTHIEQARGWIKSTFGG